MILQFAHDLRAHLGTVHIWTQLLREGRLDEKGIARGLEAISNSVETLQRLLDEMSALVPALARNAAQSGGIERAPAPGDPSFHPGQPGQPGQSGRTALRKLKSEGR